MRKLILFFGITLMVSFTFGQNAPQSHPNYGGGKHTESHGGTYKGGSGSSHKGGTYKNSQTNNTYGRHKK
jgi:hypothetical protein